MKFSFLQSQLAQMLFNQATSLSSGGVQTPLGSFVQPCPTPRGRQTPSNGMAWGMVDASPSWSASPTRWSNNEDWPREFVDESDDERMVEDLLIPSSPSCSSSSSSLRRAQSPSSRSHRAFPTTTSSGLPGSFNESSTFATTDPFYLAQVQAAKHHQQQLAASPFAQLGRPTQHSPFMQNSAQPQQQQPFAHQHSTWQSQERQTHSMFMTTTAFE